MIIEHFGSFRIFFVTVRGDRTGSHKKTQETSIKRISLIEVRPRYSEKNVGIRWKT